MFLEQLGIFLYIFAHENCVCDSYCKGANRNKSKREIQSRKRSNTGYSRNLALMFHISELVIVPKWNCRELILWKYLLT